MRNAMRGGCVRVRVRVYLDVRASRVINFEEGLEVGCYVPIQFYDPGGGVREAVGVDLPQGWGIVGLSSNGARTPRWGGRSKNPWCGTSSRAPGDRAWRKTSLMW